MKSYLWYAFALCFQIGVLTGKTNDSDKHKMFSFYNGGIQISCEYPETTQQLKMQLFKGEEVLCEFTKTKGNVGSSKNPKSCPYQLSNNSVSFFLNNLDSSQSSYYFCSLLIFDPPPFQENTLPGEYLHIYESESQLCCPLKLWLPIGCSVFIVVYIFGCIFIFWFAKKKYGSSVHDPNSEYMIMAAVNTNKKSRLAGVTP
ncbi:inducible T-cell costimulator [Phodopus roborovskii]|uniref:inducible T-cell costimulator n=1 Tax=Phodopus roborovskii TaxID=109678 RepID=UPI0021E3F68A|nr:inducible T-cell costimulator [Phodopus roborovskii]XP_051046282.1 inducible T-cell costimulator [Phodopus roborovskii]